MPPPDELELQGLFMPDLAVGALLARIREAGVPEEQIHVLSPLPLSSRASDRIGGVPLYGVTIAAGVIGIGVGLFFAAGTAVMYPLMTGGKPIVSPPIVGIISYETMMLLAIVMTFLATVARVKTINAAVHSRDERIDEGRIAVTVRVPMMGPSAGAVQDLMEQAHALDVRLSVIPSSHPPATQAVRQAASLLMPLVVGAVLAGCSQDMQEQASYQGQEAPRLRSPHGSVPMKSRNLRPVRDESQAPSEAGALLFKINCVHCHGTQGEGDGPVASFLKERPANLKSDEVRRMPVETIYRVVSDGKDMMPSFQGELSAEERTEVARFVASLSRPSVAHHRAEEDR
jgi:mono/diheme cytochrome c family protein